MNDATYYYIPLCNKDFTFENIFSCESISPISFYSRRNFGITHFYKIDEYYLDDAILLYNAIPKFKVERADGIRFLLAIKQSEIEKDDIVFISEGILGLQKTFYLTKENFKVLFFSEKDKKFILAKAELSLPTKSTKKYHKNFEVIDESLCVEINTEIIRNVKLNDNSTKEIAFDKRFNTIKGFVYGLTTEIVFQKSTEEIKLKRSIQQLINAHAEFKNKLDFRSRQSDSRYSKTGGSVTPYFDKVLHILKNLENLVFTHFPKKEISNETLSQIYFENNKTLFNSIEDAYIYLRYKFIDRVLLNSSDYDILKKKAISSLKKPDANFLIEMLKDNFKRNFSSTGSFQPSRNNSYYNEDEFKEVVFKLSFIVEDFFSNKKSDVKIDLNDIAFDPAKNEVQFKANFPFMITKAEEQEYITLINVILQRSKSEKGEAKKIDLLELVKAGANTHSKAISSSDTLLYKYLNGQLDVYPLDKVTSVVMKNFVAFIFNPDSIEALEKFLQANEIQNKWMAYSFWCTFNGFANVSSNFLKPMFEKDVEIQDTLDQYLGILRRQLAKDLVYTPENEHPFEKKLSQEVDFFEKCIAGKFELTLADLIDVLKIKKEADKLKVLRTKYNIDNKNSKHILLSYAEFIKSPNLF